MSSSPSSGAGTFLDSSGAMLVVFGVEEDESLAVAAASSAMFHVVIDLEVERLLFEFGRKT